MSLITFITRVLYWSSTYVNMVKVMLYLCRPWKHTVVERHRSSHFNLNTGWGKQLLHTLVILFQEESPGTDYLEGQLGPRTSLDGLFLTSPVLFLADEKISFKNTEHWYDLAAPNTLSSWKKNEAKEVEEGKKKKKKYWPSPAVHR